MYENGSKGITLVALVITIIILLILATISIQALTSTGLFENANKAKLETKRSQIKEWLSLNLMEVQTTNYNKTDSEILEIARKKTDSSEELKKLGKSITVDGEISTEEDGKTVPPYFDVIVDNDMYKVSMEEQEFIGEVGKIVPSVDFSATTTSKSITLKIKTKRNQGGTVECYIKGENDSNYGTGQKAIDSQYTFDNLEQGKKYKIKVVVTSGNGQKAEKEKEYTTGDVNGLTTADIEFEYSVNGTVIDRKVWTNKEIKVTAKLKVDIAGYTLVTKKNDGTWQQTDNQTFSENGIMYVALTDGRNYGDTEATANVTNIEKNAPSVNINLSAAEVTTEGTITAAVTQSDSESGINIGSCKWVYNTTAGNIGTNTSSYTGKFTSSNQNITLSSMTSGVYYLHVLSVDNAGNLTETISKGVNIFVTAVEISKTPSEYYGKNIINYNCVNNETSMTWKIFYSTKNNIYLISNDYIKREYLPSSTKDGTETSNKLSMEDTKHKQTANFNLNLLNDYSGSTNIKDTELKLLNSSYFNQNFTSEQNNMKAVAYMLDKEAWKGFKDANNKANYAIGGPTIEMLFSSYNEKNGTFLEAKADSAKGYVIKKDKLDNWNYWIQNLMSDNNNFYIIDNADNAHGMWLASPSCYYSSGLLYSYIDGSIYMDGDIKQNQLRFSTNYLFKL